jgi:hypothetical protein
VLTLSNKTCSSELTDFYFYSLFSIFCKSPELLLDRLCGLVDFKFVLSQLPRDTRHIRWTPCENVSVVPKEAGECEFLFGVEVGPDDNFLGCVGQAEANLLDSWTWSKAVVVRFCSGTCRVVWSILAARATMTVVAALIAESLDSSTVALSQF